ncbi:hypothetical protein [Natrinema sp. DC36]|nr:hypothetical protein [Natrinema sp. DC36]
MSDRAAELFKQAKNGSKTAEEAWEELKEMREEVDWDVDAIRADSEVSEE